MTKSFEMNDDRCQSIHAVILFCNLLIEFFCHQYFPASLKYVPLIVYEIMRIYKPRKQMIFSILVIIFPLSIWGQSASKKLNCEPNPETLPDNLTIRSIKIKGRGGSKVIEKELEHKLTGTKFLPKSIDTFTPSTIGKISDEISTLSLNDDANISFEKQKGIIGGATPALSGVEYLRIRSCVETNSVSQTVDLTFDILFLRADLFNIAKNILPVPRSLKPSYYNKMSPFLRTFDPQVNFEFDRKTGPEASFGVSTNLLELPALWKGEEISDSKRRLDFNFSGRKSFSKQFYQSKTGLAFSRTRSGKFAEKFEISAHFRADHQPLNDLRYINKGLQIDGQVKLRPRSGYLNTVYLGGGYGKYNNRVVKDSGQQISPTSDHKFSFRSVIDGQLLKGFARSGMWFETAKLKNNQDSYRRFAGIFAFQKEFGRGTQTIGLEGAVGGGKVWGTAPVYALFYGGNNSGSFLYESADSPAVTNFPAGPLLRSYGKTQATLANQNGIKIGGSSYWHTNFNFTIPIPAWSRRLIPDETIVYSNGTKKLNEVLETFTINTAIGGIGGDLLDSIIEDLMRKDPALDEDEAEQLAIPIAQKQAEKIVNKEIAPTIKFISRHANLFAVKPLIMLDATKLGGDQYSRYRFAAGGGLQFVVVVARAEFGYMRSFPAISGEPKGNFIFRMTFQNLF